MHAETDSRNHGLRRRAGGLLAFGLAAAMLTGCTVFAEDEVEPATLQSDTDEAAFPAVGSVPDAAPETTTAEERQVIVEELQADQAAAADPAAIQSNEFAPVSPTVVPSTSSAAAPVATADPQGYAYTNIQTPPASSSGSTMTTGGSAIATAPPAMQPLPSIEPYYGTQSAAAGQVTVDYSVLGSNAGPGTYDGQTGYYGYGQAGTPIALIYFQHGSSSLTADDRDVIRDVAELQRTRGGVIQIVGHASMRTGNVDPAAHDEANYEMSLARANAIAEALMREGVGAANVQVAAAGSSEPEYYEFTPTGEAGNRRAEIYLIY